jgi:hypothetical protein
MAPTGLYLTIFGVALAIDGLSIPLSWILYGTDEAWPEDARNLLTTPDKRRMVNRVFHPFGARVCLHG